MTNQIIMFVKFKMSTDIETSQVCEKKCTETNFPHLPVMEGYLKLNEFRRMQVCPRKMSNYDMY